ncbi:MAG TPA: hypothetical protein VJ870_15700 [Amycolatopsis sp.]|nr:hypothetical protein [Amycolatopsis sp.]
MVQVAELMVWTENVKQVPNGDKVATYSAPALISGAIGKGYVPANPTVNQIGYGIEFCPTNNTKARFTLTDFSVRMR